MCIMYIFIYFPIVYNIFRLQGYNVINQYFNWLHFGYM